MNNSPFHHDFFSNKNNTAGSSCFGNSSPNTIFGTSTDSSCFINSSSNTGIGNSTAPSLFLPQRTTNFCGPVTAFSTSGLFSGSRNALLDDAFKTLDVYVKTNEEASAVRFGLGLVRCNLNIHTLSSLQPFMVNLPDEGPMKILCVCMPGVDPATLSVELDQPAHQVLLIKGSIRGNAFELTRAAPPNMSFNTRKDLIALNQGLLTVGYTFESGRSFEKIY